MGKKVMGRGLAEANLKNGVPESGEVAWQENNSYRPRTPLGLKLQEIRARIITSGVPLLGPEEIEKEVAERRGGQE